MAKKKNRLRDSINLIVSTRSQAPNGDITEVVSEERPLRCNLNDDTRELGFTYRDIPEAENQIMAEMRKETVIANAISKNSRVKTSMTGSDIYQVSRIDFPTLRTARLLLVKAP